MTIRSSSSSGIPFGNSSSRPSSPATGQPYFNGQEKRLELYTDSGWQNIVSETPGVVSVSSTLGSVGEAVLNVTGTNFTTGAIASVIGTNGVEIQASSTTVNSIVSVTASFTGLSYLNDPYDVKITNTSNLFGLLPDAFNVNQSPVWQTAAGSLGTFNEQVNITLSALSVADPESGAVTYSLPFGSSLPSGVTLNSSTGVISGTLPDISSDTTYTFTVNATDGVDTISRSFSITSLAGTTVEYLVVAGGGAGSPFGGGGGGAGGLVYSPSYFVRTGTYNITVGAGGTSNANATGGSGGNSTFGSLVTALGGGGSGWDGVPNGVDGGSGGGAGTHGGGAGVGGAGLQPGSASGGFGNAGGNQTEQAYGAGGGGAGAVGTAGSSGGTGGIGKQYSITGTATYYAGGGGGGARSSGSRGQTAGGLGGGGIGSSSSSNNPTSGTANTGGGGGGAQGYPAGTGSTLGGNGGSGVVIIAYPSTQAAAVVTGTYDQPTRSGYRVYRFTGNGTITF